MMTDSLKWCFLISAPLTISLCNGTWYGSTGTVGGWPPHQSVALTIIGCEAVGH